MPRHNLAMRRREFIGVAGAALACAQKREDVCLLIDPADPVASSAPVRWVAQELGVRQCEHQGQVRAGERAIVVSGMKDVPESLTIGGDPQGRFQVRGRMREGRFMRCWNSRSRGFNSRGWVWTGRPIRFAA